MALLQWILQQEALKEERKRRDAIQDFETFGKILNAPPQYRDVLFDYWGKQKSPEGKLPPEIEAYKQLLKRTDEENVLLLKQVFGDITQGLKDNTLDVGKVYSLYGDPIKTMEFVQHYAGVKQREADLAELSQASQAPAAAAVPAPRFDDPSQAFFDDYWRRARAGEPVHGDVVQGPPIQEPPLQPEPPAPLSPLEELRQRRDRIEREVLPRLRTEHGRQNAKAVLDRLDKQIAEMSGSQTDIGKLQADRDAMLRGGMKPDSPAIQAIDRKIARAGIETPQSAMGKAGDDLARAERLYGKDSLQYQAILDSLQTGGEPPKLSDEHSLRGQYVNLSKDFLTIRDSYGRIQEAGKNPSAAGDLALIFNYMKLLDPGSVVREAEFATAENAAGVPERVRAVWNKLLSGERLSDAMRADFLRQAEGQFASQLRFQKALEQQYRGIAKKAGMDPDRIVVDFIGNLRGGGSGAGKKPARSDVDAAKKLLGIP